MINQKLVGGNVTTYLNRVTSSLGAATLSFEKETLDALFEAHWGPDTNKWYSHVYDSFGLHYTLRFPTAFETKSGSLDNGGNFDNFLSTGRLAFNSQAVFLQTGNANATGSLLTLSNGSLLSSYLFGVINDYSLTLVSFTDVSRSTLNGFYSMGWLKDGRYASSAYPRNLYAAYSGGGKRVGAENLSGSVDSLVQNPSLACKAETAGADATDVIFRDAQSPNYYIGKLWNMIVLPSAAVVGKIYKNGGADPDTGQVEVDQAAFWLCLGQWGTDKIGVRVWTENII